EAHRTEGSPRVHAGGDYLRCGGPLCAGSRRRRVRVAAARGAAGAGADRRRSGGARGNRARAPGARRAASRTFRRGRRRPRRSGAARVDPVERTATPRVAMTLAEEAVMTDVAERRLARTDPAPLDLCVGV